jgi:hypothetical protein
VTPDLSNMYHPVYWLLGIAIFSAGAWLGRAAGLRSVHPGSWRQMAGLALILAGFLAGPSTWGNVSGPPPGMRGPALPAAAVTPARVKVVVAKTTLPAQTPLSADNVELKDVASDGIQPNAAEALTDVQGKALTVPVAAGQQILTSYLVDPSALPLPGRTTPPIQPSPAVMSPADTAAEITAVSITPTNTKVGDTVDMKITVKNISAKPLQTMGPEPGFTYVQGQTYSTQQFASDPGKWRVAIGAAGLDATELPYRWGLGGDLAPGASTTVTGHIKITHDFKTTNFWSALVNEPSTIAQTGVGMTLVTSLAQNLAIVAVGTGSVSGTPSP